MQAKEGVGPEEASNDGAASATGAIARASRRPLLLVDIDGVISLFGAFSSERRGDSVEGSFHAIEGIPHFLSATAAAHLLALEAQFELVWASGWEERAGEHLPHLLGLPKGLHFLRFARDVGRTHAHWKLDAIDAFAPARALAWIDDALDDACREWAERRAAPTLLVQTDPELGLTDREAALLSDWARSLTPPPQAGPQPPRLR